ncbi:MAG: hypothetical protein IJ422_07060 [Oscillospiraceae bacterium]|nr:hypothetical protein [Oscillospiraceae bacterium]MBQ9148209.1 hypothetical protein [Oscillospiraceae bacterium]
MRKLCKLIALLSVLAMLVGCGATEEPDADPDTNIDMQETEATEPVENVKVFCMTGLVHTLNGNETEYTVSYEDDRICLTPQLTSPDSYKIAYIYSWDGRLLEEQSLNEDGTLDSKTEYDYDEAGRLLERRIIYPDDDKTARRTYEYNQQGKLICMTYYSYSGAVDSKYTYAYDQRGYLAECLVTGYQDVEDWRYVYTCDETGKVIGGQRFVLNERFGELGLQSDLIYTYDDAGNLLGIAWKPVVESSYLRQSKFFAYDEQGRMIDYQVFHQETVLYEEETYQYGEDGYLLGVQYERDHLTSSWAFIYGEAEVDSRMAENVQLWSSSGVITAFTPVADPVLS